MVSFMLKPLYALPNGQKAG